MGNKISQLSWYKRALLVSTLFFSLVSLQSLVASEHLDMKTGLVPPSLDAYRDVQIKKCSGNCPNNGTWSVVANANYGSNGSAFIAFLLTTGTWYEAKVLQPFGNACALTGTSMWVATVSSGIQTCPNN